jgi:hypothetical protein
VRLGSMSACSGALSLFTRMHLTIRFVTGRFHWCRAPPHVFLRALQAFCIGVCHGRCKFACAAT